MAGVEEVRTAHRVAVVGSPSAGKSTLARRIAAATGLPLIHLDQEHWRPGWVEPPLDEWRTIQRGLVARERWVIDGNYGRELAMRAERADVIVWLDPPTMLCLWRVIKRVVTTGRRARPDMAPGCPERFAPTSCATWRRSGACSGR